MESDYITRLDLEYDKKELVKEVESLEFKPVFSSPNIKHTWLKARVKDDIQQLPHIKSLHSLFEGSIVVAYRLQPHAFVHMHVDPTTLCSINIILSDEYAPAEFEGFGKVMYECALFNTSVNHAVPAYDKERLLLKFAYLDTEYGVVRKRLENYLSVDVL